MTKPRTPLWLDIIAICLSEYDRNEIRKIAEEHRANEASQASRNPFRAYVAAAHAPATSPPAAILSRLTFAELGAVKTLKLKYPFTLVQLKQVYKAEAALHHPDHGGDPEKFREATKAYELLLASALP